MSISEALAQGVAAASRVVLRDLFHRDAANFPGKIGLYLDKSLIAHASCALERGSLCVVGTNGKTTTTNLICSALEAAGMTVCCNKTGANLDSGVASALLETGNAQWGVFECDELWLAHILPQLQANYVLLLNLFRDQLDRAGEIELVQERIVAALAGSPETVLVYNADDPLCAAIARKAPNESIAFGVQENLTLAQNSVIDAQLCQMCGSSLAYEYRQYGQLGKYRCPTCGFERPVPDFAIGQVAFSENSVAFSVTPRKEAAPHASTKEAWDAENGQRFTAQFPSPYMLYNLAAASIGAHLLGCDAASLQRAFDGFCPHNGRLERLSVGGHATLINLAKNPTGMNQNLRIALSDPCPFALGIFINDKEADGHDISWLWDVDFEELTARNDVHVFAGGIRRNDLQVRLKYAGVQAELVDDAAALVAQANAWNESCSLYAIANYTALPAVKTALERLAQPAEEPAAAFAGAGGAGLPAVASAEPAPAAFPAPSTSRSNEPVVIAHVLPEILSLYGDRGNVMVLKKRLEWRGIPVEVRALNEAASFDLTDADLVFLGGAPDREQEIAQSFLQKHAAQLAAFIDGGGVCLAICGGYQMLGRSWVLNGKDVPGLGIGAFETRRAGSAHDRLVGNIALHAPGIARPVIGYENHAGRTYLDIEARAFGRVASKCGHGNNDTSGSDGFTSKNLLGTYLHGPLLAKNPELADDLLKRALEHRAERLSESFNAETALCALDDTVETQANEFMAKRLMRAAL